jgi:hypothetical protein
LDLLENGQSKPPFLEVLSNFQSELGSIDVPPQLSYDRALAFAYRWLADADLCSDVRFRPIS